MPKQTIPTDVCYAHSRASQLPEWVHNLDATELEWELENHITTVMRHYRGQVLAWDIIVGTRPFSSLRMCCDYYGI